MSDWLVGLDYRIDVNTLYRLISPRKKIDFYVILIDYDFIEK